MDHREVSGPAAVARKTVSVRMWRKAIAVLFTGFGALLLVFSLLGLNTYLGRYESKTVIGERFDAALAPKLKSVNELYGEALMRQGNWQNATSEEKMSAFYDVVVERFTYGSKAKYNLFSNWIMWVLGLFNSDAAYISDPDILLKYGFSIMCHQSSWVLATLAKKENLPFRHVELSGHVVMEAWWGDAWHLYDPSFEVIPLREGTILSGRDLEDKPYLVKLFYGNRGDCVEPLFATKYDNSFVTDGMFIWKAEVLSLIERVSNYAKWALPILMIIVGICLFLLGIKKGG
ncbi:hypothetical protein ISS37_03995 [candidate division KSB1 bacterium]|nr:hypothetical protein [candidate division KSB1 bacterium]